MVEKSQDFKITPETKIGTLLESFPRLEGVLLEMAPEFKKLKNPLLRKTIARMTSLRQAAALAKIPLSKMINTLRDEAGIVERFIPDGEAGPLSSEAPSWFSPARIAQRLDARAMLERGEQPIQKVFSECKNLKDGEIFELITPFLPAPLIERARQQGYRVWVNEEENGTVKTYLTLK